MYNMGMFDPQNAPQALMCLEMMNFEGKEKIVRKIRDGIDLSVQSQHKDGGKSTSDSESSLLSAYKNNLPGNVTLEEAKRSLPI